MERLQGLVDAAAHGLNETFSDLARHSRLLDDLRANLTAVRARCIGMYTALWTTNREVHWLGRAVHAPWIDIFHTAQAKMDARVREADIWNQCSKGKNVIERSVGKDAMFAALRAAHAKRARVDDAHDEGEGEGGGGGESSSA